MTTLEQVNAWTKLREYIGQIPPCKFKTALREDMRRRALNNWGWVPGENTCTAEPDLDDWEKEFLMDVRDTIEFGIDTRKEKRANIVSVVINAKLAMLDWIRTGHTLHDIPEEIRTPEIVALYNDCDNYLQAELWHQIENLKQEAEK